MLTTALSSARTSPITRGVRRKLRSALDNAVRPAESGVHVDPADLPPVDLATHSRWFREALSSPEMDTFRAALTLGDLDVRDSVLDDLATHHGITPAEARRRCLHWEQDSLREWADVNGSVVDFYRTQHSWAFDLMWWAYLQSEGHGDPSSVLAVRFLQQWAPGRRHLDFGSGVGVTTQVFLAGGWTSTMADLSSTLLDFATFRLARRGLHPDVVDLYEQALPAGAYDAVTAIDTLAHVPDVNEAARRLHTALARDGVLIANFDIRSPAPETVWHLQDDDLRAVYDLRRAGFVPIGSMGYGLVGYRKVPARGLRHRLRTAGAWLRLVSPPRRWARRTVRRIATSDAMSARRRRRAGR